MREAISSYKQNNGTDSWIPKHTLSCKKGRNDHDVNGMSTLLCGGQAEGKASLNWLLGGKGANLAEMAGLGLPVPPGMTITTEVCSYYYTYGHTYPPELSQQFGQVCGRVEKIIGRRFGHATNPLLLSVRSGARVSMPGMMDTVLNLGLNDKTVQGLIQQSGNPRFAYDATGASFRCMVISSSASSHNQRSNATPLSGLLRRKKQQKV